MAYFFYTHDRIVMESEKMSILLTRKSIRKYNENHIIHRNELEEIIEIANRAPSSQNLQPTRLVVIESNEAKEKVRETLYGNNLQLDTASAFIVLFTDINKYRHTEKILNSSVEHGTMTHEIKEKQSKSIAHVQSFLTEEKILHDGILDAGLYAMQLMLAAKDKGYDTCPIGGFNKSIINEKLGIESNLKPVLIISLGKADEDGFDSIRLPLEDIVTYL